VNRVLLVEDDPTIREMTRMTLERDGFVVETAGDGQSGLDAFDRRPPDIVLLDVMLPGMDGVSVCRRIRAKSVVPIVMLSARTDPIDVVLGLEAGADDYVTKPFEPPILSARLRAVLRRATRMAEGSRMRFGDLEIDPKGMVVTRDGITLHHLIEPSTGLPVHGPWRTATVLAGSCVEANTASTAVIVRGASAVEWFEASGLPARLVSEAGAVHRTHAWPQPLESAA